MRRRRRGNPTDWTPVIVLAAAGGALYFLWPTIQQAINAQTYNATSGQGGPIGNLAGATTPVASRGFYTPGGLGT